ncbi:MAG: hypothetical protein KGJ93_04215 [Patescibacteria group bacterium]|nr:hypothetical protein [Patescibacteria group bacterium]
MSIFGEQPGPSWGLGDSLDSKDAKARNFSETAHSLWSHIQASGGMITADMPFEDLAAIARAEQSELQGLALALANRGRKFTDEAPAEGFGQAPGRFSPELYRKNLILLGQLRQQAGEYLTNHPVDKDRSEQLGSVYRALSAVAMAEDISQLSEEVLQLAALASDAELHALAKSKSSYSKPLTDTAVPVRTALDKEFYGAVQTKKFNKYDYMSFYATFFEIRQKAKQELDLRAGRQVN